MNIGDLNDRMRKIAALAAGASIERWVEPEHYGLGFPNRDTAISNRLGALNEIERMVEEAKDIAVSLMVRREEPAEIM